MSSRAKLAGFHHPTAAAFAQAPQTYHIGRHLGFLEVFGEDNETRILEVPSGRVGLGTITADALGQVFGHQPARSTPEAVKSTRPLWRRPGKGYGNHFTFGSGWRKASWK